MTRFKNVMQQKAYEKARRLAAQGEMPNRHFGSFAEAYWHGRNGTDKKYLRSSLGYAAYRAGLDDRKFVERKVRGG